MSKLGDGIKSASSTAREGAASAREQANKAYGAGREAAARGVQTSKEMAHKAAMKSGDAIDRNPIAVVLGGLAVGAIVGALLPRTEREKKALAPAGKKINERATQVADAAKKAGKEKIDALGLNGDAVREQFRDLVNKATEAVKAAGQAAGEAARKKD